MLDSAQLLRNNTLSNRKQTICNRGFIRVEKPLNSLALQPFRIVKFLFFLNYF